MASVRIPLDVTGSKVTFGWGGSLSGVLIARLFLASKNGPTSLDWSSNPHEVMKKTEDLTKRNRVVDSRRTSDLGTSTVVGFQDEACCVRRFVRFRHERHTCHQVPSLRDRRSHGLFHAGTPDRTGQIEDNKRSTHVTQRERERDIYI